jgi:hypothetical protein
VAVGTGPHPVDVEKVTHCPQSVTETGSAPSPPSTVEHTTAERRVYRVEQPSAPWAVKVGIEAVVVMFVVFSRSSAVASAGRDT